MRKMNRAMLLAVVLALALFGGVLASNQALITPAISWWTVDSGGGQSSGSGYTLTGTVGQPDASQKMNGRPYTVTGGYWGSLQSGTNIYLPLVLD